jgi:ectoine hydroxylase-related dioxygenase (phytanoyl-CoA dioxygenase family)
LGTENALGFMLNFIHIKEEILSDGFAVLNDIFNIEEINYLLSIISDCDTSRSNFRQTTHLFAIRQFLKEVPASSPVIFNSRFNSMITELFGADYFVVKSIYFDKPEASNWWVAYHQDLTISVDKKMDIPGFGPWTIKQDQFAVQPPLDILKDNFTVRIHLDDTNEENGALNIIPKSHLKGIYRPETINWQMETEQACCVKRGGVMLMKPLLLHASKRTTNNSKRRVVHIEFSRSSLPDGLKWTEFQEMNGYL